MDRPQEGGFLRQVLRFLRCCISTENSEQENSDPNWWDLEMGLRFGNYPGYIQAINGDIRPFPPPPAQTVVSPEELHQCPSCEDAYQEYIRERNRAMMNAEAEALALVLAKFLSDSEAEDGAKGKVAVEWLKCPKQKGKQSSLNESTTSDDSDFEVEEKP